MGHYCWCCNRHRANERFSGRGHRDHICRDCQQLPKEERKLRSARRNINRCIGPDGLIRKKHREHFDSYLDHDNEAVRKYAERCLEEHRFELEELRRLRELERSIENPPEELSPVADESSRNDVSHSDTERSIDFDDEIPF